MQHTQHPVGRDTPDPDREEPANERHLAAGALMTLRAEPLIPRWGVMLVALAVLAGMLLAVWRNNWIALVVQSLVLLFILGADVAAMLRAWRGTPEVADTSEPGP